MTVNMLLVDDEIHWLEGLAETIPWESHGIDHLFMAQNGFEALKLLESYPIDIVVTDVLMPGMTGIELIEQIRQTWNGIKCIILSGYAEFEYAQKALSCNVSEYLLKPVRDEAIIKAVTNAGKQLEEEWGYVVSAERAAAALRENLSLLKGTYLEGLLSGRKVTPQEWAQKKDWYELPFEFNTSCCLMMVRLEGRFLQEDENSLSLYEFSVCNIAEEIFRRHFDLWHCRDKHDYLVILATRRSDDAGSGAQTITDAKRLFEQCVVRLQHNVRVYLKGTVSVLLTEWGIFPSDVSSFYQASLTTFRQHVGKDQEVFLGVANAPVPSIVKGMEWLYESPRMVHLLEAGRWAELDDKLARLFEELNEHFGDSQEHVLEAGIEISGAFIYLAHKNGQRLSEWIGPDYEKLANGTAFRSIQELKQWAERLTGKIKSDIEKEMMHTRSDMIRKLHRYIEEHLTEDLSLQTMAEHVYLHPNHLSKIYRLETGETLSSYLNRFRMEKAAYLLGNSDEKKIYRIGERVGFPSSAYFIKVFKKYFGLTPQEYRDAKT